MGYRSDVAISFRDKGMIPPDVIKALDEMEAESYSSNSDVMAVLYVILSIKWYDSYKNVQTVEEYLAQVRSEEGNQEYLFLRIGEDTADVEEHSWLNNWTDPFNVYVSKSISFDGELSVRSDS